MSSPYTECARPCRIVVFSLAYAPYESGAEEAVREVVARCNSAEYDFTIITAHIDPSLPREEQHGHVRVVRVGRGGSTLSKVLFALFAGWEAARRHRCRPFHGAWALMTYMIVPVLVARVLGVRIPFGITLQEGDTYEHVFQRWWVHPFAPLLDYGFRKAEIIQAISRFLATWPRLRGAHATPVVLIPNAATDGQFTLNLSDEEAKELRARITRSDRDVVLFNAARLVRQKGHDVVIRALTRLPPHVRYVIAGSGSEEEFLRRLAHELGVADRVVFLGYVPPEEVPRWRNPHVVDIFVGLSRSEGLGNSFLSALAAGLPVVATQVGGLADFIFDPERNPDRDATAWAVDPDDPDQCAARITYVLEHPEEAQRVAEQGKRFVAQYYRWDTVAARMRREFFSHLCCRASQALH